MFFIVKEKAISVWTSPKFCTLVLRANPLRNKPWFLRVCSRNLLKALWVKEKLLVTGNFSFSRSDFYPFGELPVIFIKFEIVAYKLLQFGRVQNLSFEKGIKMPFILFNPLTDDKILDWSKLNKLQMTLERAFKMSAIKGRKHCEKKRNCLLQAISPFLTMFSTAKYL